MKYWLELVALWAISLYASGYNGNTPVTKQSEEEHGVTFDVKFQELDDDLLHVTRNTPTREANRLEMGSSRVIYRWVRSIFVVDLLPKQKPWQSLEMVPA